jgi:thiamine biosynthesis lipoprotein
MGHWQLDPEGQTVTLKETGVEINFNAIGKGYALDQAAGWLTTQGIDDYLWHGGLSSLLARGRNRAIDCRLTHDEHTGDEQPYAGQLNGWQDENETETRKSGYWTVGLPHPLQPARRLAEIHLRDSALATAGSKTQFFEQDGTCFGHLIDPRTGWPANRVITATAIAPTAAEADALATAFYIMGPEQAGDYCQLHPQVKAILVCPGEQNTNIMVHAMGMTAVDWTAGEMDSDPRVTVR